LLVSSQQGRVDTKKVSPQAQLPIRLVDQLCFSVYAASRALIGVYRDLLKDSDLTYPQYIVMIALWEQDRIKISELCQSVCLDYGTLTPLLKRLELRGVLLRSRDPQDERVVRLIVTDAGWQLQKKVAGAPHKLRYKISLSRDETTKIRLTMKTLIQDLKAEA